MFNLPDKYKVGKKIPMKDFIPKAIKPDVKKKIKDSIKSIILRYQIMGEDIPSVLNNEYNCQAIQFYDFEITDIKKAAFVASFYQEIIKSPCVLRIHDNANEIYSFALKRLNKNDNTQIVVMDKLLTAVRSTVLLSTGKNILFHELSFANIKNKDSKVSFYTEMYLRAYILTNEKVCANAKDFLQKPIWYSESKVNEVYALLCKLKATKENVQTSINDGEKMQLNQEIKKLITALQKI